MPGHQKTNLDKKKNKLCTNIDKAFSEKARITQFASKIEAEKAWDETFEQEAEELIITKTNRKELKVEEPFVQLKNSQLTKLGFRATLKADTPTTHHEGAPVTFVKMHQSLPPKPPSPTIQSSSASPAESKGEESYAPPIAITQAEDKQLKKFQIFIEQYIKEIKSKIKTKINKQEEPFWNNEIIKLEEFHFYLHDPKSEAAKTILKDYRQSNDIDAVNLINDQLNNNAEKFFTDKPKSFDKSLLALKNKVLDHFFLLKTDLGEGAQFIFTKIAGTPKTKPNPDNRLEESIQKDLEKIRELYIQEINSMTLNSSAEKQYRKEALKELAKLKLSSKEFMQTYDPDKKNFDIAISKFILDKIDINNFFPYKAEEALAKKIATKFLEASAPASHKNLIKKVNQYIEKLEKKPSSSNKNESNGNLFFAENLHRYLSANDPSTLQRHVNNLREFQEKLTKDNKKEGLYDLIEEALKISDPYYDDIKKLDTYIAGLEKDLTENPQKKELGKNESNRQKKLEIARHVKAILTSSVEIEQGRDITADKIKTAIADNTQHTKTFMGKGKLDGILKGILLKVEPEEAHKKKPKP